MGLLSALVLAIVGLTGVVLVWPDPSLARRIAGRLHDTLALGSIGGRLVLAVTVAAVALQLSGLILWWKRRTLRVRVQSGWKPFVIDVHHSVGVIGLTMMLLLATTAIGMSVLTPRTELRRTMVRLHTTTGFPTAIKMIYAVGSGAFLLQSASGVAMWWRAKP
jgi:uncharacterized iron-regulated membrane protein